MSVCPCIHHFQKRAVTFYSLDRPQGNFQGLLNWLQVTFGWVTRTPGPSRSGPDPRKRVSAKYISSEGFEAGGLCHTFSESEQQGNQKVLEPNFAFWSTARENGAGRRNKILEFQYFFIKGTAGSFQQKCARSPSIKIRFKMHDID